MPKLIRPTSHASPGFAISRSNPTPIYRQIAEQLRQRISADEFAKDHKLPSNRELAESYKVNHLTVRQALKVLEEEGVIDIAHGRGAFVLDSSLKRLQTALVLPSLGQEQSGLISEAVRKTLGRNAILHVFDYHNHPEEEAACLENMLRENYNSAIIYPSMRGEGLRIILRMLVEGFPFVLVDRRLGNVPSFSVISDNENGGYLATKHLISKGCKRVACFAWDVPSVKERVAGYSRALAEAGMRLDPRLIVELPPEGDVEETATTKFLKKQPPPDGIFYCNDYGALVGMKQIKAAGLRIPEDIKVIGFDDHTLARYSEPTLTSVRQDHETMGQEAVGLLLEQLKLPASQRFSFRTSVIPVQLVERESA